MAKLYAAQRNALPTSTFAGPDRSFPIPDISHGRDALREAGHAANPAAIRAKVHAKFPQIGQRVRQRVLEKMRGK